MHAISTNQIADILHLTITSCYCTVRLRPVTCKIREVMKIIVNVIGGNVR